MKVGQAVAVVCQKQVFVSYVFLNCTQSLPDVGVNARVRKSDFPIVYITVCELQILASLRQYEVIRKTLIVIEEVLLNEIAAVSKTQYKIPVPEVGVVFHHMPENRAVADCDHWFWDVVRVVPQPQS